MHLLAAMTGDGRTVSQLPCPRRPARHTVPRCGGLAKILTRPAIRPL
ncbi:hypothetical protein T261_7917 [Streptomyces lydicus]|nr:hypothetical protein T261_7917 [Streptomyces lydicus]